MFFFESFFNSLFSVTSSPELAEPQSEQLEGFYKMFNFSSSHIEVTPKKETYKKDILYGAIDDFEADILRDEYSKLGTRSKRPFEVVIVDEVDSMLIDGRSFMVRIASAMPGMSEMEPVLAAIWIHADLVASQIEEDEDGNAYYKMKNQ
ncbi:MAG: hypothetical protein JXR30_02810 [Alphaproteobacteria bacterium]|nr:hypothetical protein [Alphaproteobacteria bacterium]